MWCSKLSLWRQKHALERKELTSLICRCVWIRATPSWLLASWLPCFVFFVCFFAVYKMLTRNSWFIYSTETFVGKPTQFPGHTLVPSKKNKLMSTKSKPLCRNKKRERERGKLDSNYDAFMVELGGWAANWSSSDRLISQISQRECGKVLHHTSLTNASGSHHTVVHIHTSSSQQDADVSQLWAEEPKCFGYQFRLVLLAPVKVNRLPASRA